MANPGSETGCHEIEENAELIVVECDICKFHHKAGVKQVHACRPFRDGHEFKIFYVSTPDFVNNVRC